MRRVCGGALLQLVLLLPFYSLGNRQNFIFNLGFPKTGSSSFFSYLQCLQGPSTTTAVRGVSHYLCGRKTISNSREYQTCGECIQRVAAGGPMYLQESCSGAWAFTQMDYANSSDCAFPQIENLEYLLTHYPEAKYVLLTRPFAHWIHSVKHFFDLKARLLDCLEKKSILFPTFNNMRSETYNMYMNNSDRLLIDWYEWHVHHVTQVFKKRNMSNFIIIDIEDSYRHVESLLDTFFKVEKLTCMGNCEDAVKEKNISISRQCWGHHNRNTRKL